MNRLYTALKKNWWDVKACVCKLRSNPSWRNAPTRTWKYNDSSFDLQQRAYKGKIQRVNSRVRVWYLNLLGAYPVSVVLSGKRGYRDSYRKWRSSAIFTFQIPIPAAPAWNVTPRVLSPPVYPSLLRLSETIAPSALRSNAKGFVVRFLWHFTQLEIKIIRCLSERERERKLS